MAEAVSATPGPWAFINDEIVGADDSTSVALVGLHDGLNPAEWQANASLIAAAPEMRDVLLMIRALKIPGKTKIMLPSDGAIMQALEAVLAKTEGV